MRDLEPVGSIFPDLSVYARFAIRFGMVTCVGRDVFLGDQPQSLTQRAGLSSSSFLSPLSAPALFDLDRPNLAR